MTDYKGEKNSQKKSPFMQKWKRWKKYQNNVDDQQFWYQKDFIALNDSDDENNWCKFENWKNRLNDVDEKQKKNENENVLRYLNEVEKDANFEKFETLYK